MQYKYKNVVNM